MMKNNAFKVVVLCIGLGAPSILYSAQAENINTLPVELLDYILSEKTVFLGDVGTIVKVCKKWKTVMYANPVYKKTCQLLQKSKGDLDIALLKAAQERESFAVMELLVVKGANVDYRDNDLGAPLHIAAQMGNLKAVQFLVDKGADIDAVNGLGKTSLVLARENKHDEVVQVFKEIVSRKLALRCKELFVYYF